MRMKGGDRKERKERGRREGGGRKGFSITPSLPPPSPLSYNSIRTCLW